VEYRVSWFIDVDAESPREAAEKALQIQRDPASTAVVFDVAEAAGVTGLDGEDLYEPAEEIDLGVQHAQ